MKVQFKLLNGIVPKKQTPESVGYDLFAANEYEILPGNLQLINLGFCMTIEPGYEAQIRSRSGLALKNKIFVLNSPGTIDPDYRGELGVILMNLGENSFKIKKHDRIAQMIFAKIENPAIEILENLEETSRKGGWGSTGLWIFFKLGYLYIK